MNDYQKRLKESSSNLPVKDILNPSSSSQLPEGKSHSFYSEIDFSKERLWRKYLAKSGITDSEETKLDVHRKIHRRQNSSFFDDTPVQGSDKPFNELLEMELHKPLNAGSALKPRVLPPLPELKSIITAADFDKHRRGGAKR